MKKYLAVILALLLIISSVSACEKASTEPETEHNAEPAVKEPTPEPQPEPKPQPEPEPEPEPDPQPEPQPVEYEDPYAGYTDDGYRPMMWRVTDGEGHELYLFGTIHAGDERMNSVMKAVTSVLNGCDALAVEFDTVAYNSDMETATQDMMQFLYRDGTTIVDHMPEELYDRAVALLKEAGAYSPVLEYYNTAMWSLLCEQAAAGLYATIDFENAAEAHLISYAYSHDKPVYSVESASFQYAMMNGFPEELNLIIIEDTLDGLDEYGSSLTELFDTWLSGDYDAISKLALSDYSDAELTEEELQLLTDYDKTMLDDRNLGMAEKAKEYLASGETVFFAVGTAHMLGEPGIVSLLRNAGYTVERYDY